MKEHPIIFTTELIPKILDGSKTQTRRVIKPQPNAPVLIWERCPYGQVGDRLWVREKALYWDGGAGGRSEPVYADNPMIPLLLEDNNRLLIPRTLQNIEDGESTVGKWVWKPSIHMYREDSHITLERGQRCEVLQAPARTADDYNPRWAQKPPNWSPKVILPDDILWHWDFDFKKL